MGLLLHCGKLLLGPSPQREMHSLSAHIEIARDGFGIPSVGMQPDDGSSALRTVLDVRIAWITALGGRWCGTRGQNELDGSWSGLAVEFDEADRRQLMGTQN